MSSTPIVENVGSTTTAYVLDSTGVPMEAAQGSTAVYLTDDPKGDLSTTMGASIWPLCQIQYDPYGTVVFGLSPSNHCESGSTFVDLLYQNQRVDSASGDYQLGSRTYDPSKNSFLSPDHFQLGTSAQDLSIQVDPLTENAYTFVNGDPVNYFDPTGHSEDCGCSAPQGNQPPCYYTGTCVVPQGGGTAATNGGSYKQKVSRPDGPPAPVRPPSPLLKAHIAQEEVASFAGARWGYGLDANCVYEGGDVPVCPDWQGIYNLTPSQYEADGGYAPGDPKPQAPTFGDVLGFAATMVGVATFWDGLGAMELSGGGEAASVDASADSVVSTATDANSNPIVIGENMQGRVIPQAREIGADYYQPAPGTPPSQWMVNNKVWIQEQMARGRQIIDIGPDPARGLYPAETSPYYAMEHGEIFGSGYNNYVQYWLDEPAAFLKATAH
jgi:RHS repeat-associated protein